MEINEYLKLPRIDFPTFPTGGVIGTAADTVDRCYHISINQLDVDQVLTLPAPTDPTSSGLTVLVYNRGARAFVMHGEPIGPRKFSMFVWEDTAWRGFGGSAADFWRSGVGGTTLPDTVNDNQQDIRRDGEVGIRVDPLSTLDIGGSFATRTLAITNPNAVQSLGSLEQFVEFSVPCTISFPDPATCPGREYQIQLSAGNASATATVNSVGGAQIELPGGALAAGISISHPNLRGGRWKSNGVLWEMMATHPIAPTILMSRNSPLQAAGDSGVTDTNMTATGVDTTGKVRLANAISIPDLRATNPNPQDFAAGETVAFKELTILGIPTQRPSAGLYGALKTIRRYAQGADFSGGQVRQEMTSDRGNKFYRMSTSPTVWDVWREYETMGSRGLAEPADLVAGVVPNGFTSYQDFNGNWVPNFTLPAGGPRAGESFTFQHLAGFDTIINVTNTNMTAPLLVTAAMGGASFDWVGGVGKWALVSENPSSKPRTGDLKDALRAGDHNGWYRLDGRLVSALPATAQASWLALFPATTNIITAAGKYNTDDGSALGSTSGAVGNSITLAQAQLPNVTLTATAVPGHVHTTTGANTGAGAQAATGNVANGSAGLVIRSAGGVNTVANTDTSAGEPNVIAAPVNHTHVTDSQGGHSHPVPLGGSGAAISIKPASMSVATFVYLG